MNRMGYSSRLGYEDSCAYEDKLTESTGPLKHILDPTRVMNCDACLSTLGPRTSFMGFGVSTPVGNRPAQAQAGEVVNIESILKNLNVKKSKCKKDEANPIDVTKFKLKNPRVCNDFLNPLSSKLSYPPANYRDVGINRFYNLNKNPQKNIFWNFSENTTLQIKDNFFDEIPEMWSLLPSLPRELKGRPKPMDLIVENPPLNEFIPKNFRQRINRA